MTETTPQATYIPATPGWQAVYSSPQGIAVYKDVAFWAVPAVGQPEALVGNIGGLRLASGAFGNFVGIKGPNEDVTQWNQTVSSLAVALVSPVKETSDVPPLAEVPSTPDKKYLFTGTVSGVAANNVVQILPDGGGPVEDHRNFGVGADVKIEPGARVQLFETSSGLLLEAAPV